MEEAAWSISPLYWFLQHGHHLGSPYGAAMVTAPEGAIHHGPEYKQFPWKCSEETWPLSAAWQSCGMGTSANSGSDWDHGRAGHFPLKSFPLPGAQGSMSSPSQFAGSSAELVRPLLHSSLPFLS